MKRFIVAVLCIAFAVGLASAPAAAYDKELHGQVSFDFWFSDMELSVAGTDYDSDQTYVPMIALDIEFAPGWSAAIEYANGLSDDITPTTAASDEMESDKFLIGVEYGWECGWFANFAWQQYQFDETYPGGNDSVDIDGIRLGGGYAFDFENSNWGGAIEAGFGISNDSSISSSGASLSGDADVLDLAVTFDYTWDSGWKADLGYRYVNMDVDILGASLDIDLTGPFFGFGYVW